ncbi:MAG: PHP domain-containing protein [Bacteroidota bacterium]
MPTENKKIKYSLLIFTIIIAVLASILHYPVHIVDALSLESAKGFDIHISIWRILFEPFLGHLLYFNRGFYTLVEIKYVLYWIVIIFILYSIFWLFAKRIALQKRTFIVGQVLNLPMIVGLWFTIFVVMILMSVYLPSNTIVNNSNDNILVTTHSHTQFSHDGIISQENLWEWHKRNGFDAFFITDHNTHEKTIDFINEQRNGDFPMTPLVLGGEEFSGTNHLSLLGLKRKFDTHGYSDSQAIDSTRANNGVVVVNHWFDDENMSLEYYKDLGVDGFEIENTATDLFYPRDLNSKIAGFCTVNGLMMNGGADFHGYGNVCSLWNAFKLPGWDELSVDAKELAILNIIKKREQDKLKVLMYNDRPYYAKTGMFWRPVISFFNYFRTLNVWQFLSWVFWIFIFMSVDKLRKLIFTDKAIAVLSFVSALFLLILALNYYLEIEEVAGSDNDIYIEYSTFLFYSGTAFLVYSGIIVYLRIVRDKFNIRKI